MIYFRLTNGGFSESDYCPLYRFADGVRSLVNIWRFTRLRVSGDRHQSPESFRRVVETKARPGLVILYHQLFFGASEETLLGEVRARFGGRVVSAHDLEVY